MSDWKTAAYVLREVLLAAGLIESQGDIGRVERLGEGLTYRVFTAVCELRDGPRRVAQRLVVRLPYPGATVPDRGADVLTAESQAALLARLAALGLRVRLPRVIGTQPVACGTALVETFVDGHPVDLRAGRVIERPWELVAEAAAICHGADAAAVRDVVPGFATRRDHAAACLRCAAGFDIPEAPRVVAWGEERLPPPTPARLLHGDLLGQNLLLRFDDGEHADLPLLGVIDWQRSLVGDPAFDLAIVTRGVAKPFQTQGGLQRLLDAYAARAPEPVLPGEVRFHEALLLAELCAAHAREHGLESPIAAQERSRLLRFLDRAR